MDSMNLKITCSALAGRLPSFLENWQLVTQDAWILQVVKGYCIEFISTPCQSHIPPEMHTSAEMQSQVMEEIKDLLEKGAIEEVQPGQDSFISQLFLVEKKGGGFRPVVNLKGLNQFIKAEHFKMEGLHLLPSLIQQGDWMVKLDLKDAYLQVAIHPHYHHFLQFQWQGSTYQFKCLPFGLSVAPRVFTKLLKPVVGLLRQAGTRLIIYLDDLLILHQSKEVLEVLVIQTCQLFEGLGLMINKKKSHLLPVQNLEFLGFQVCSNTMRFVIPKEKLRKIRQDAHYLLQQSTVSVRELARFVGKTSATVRAIPTAPLHYRAIQRLMNSVSPSTPCHPDTIEKFNVQVQLSRGVKDDLAWWAGLASEEMGAKILSPVPSLVLESDASNMGWGATNGKDRTGGRWSLEETTHHINYLELLAIFLALKTFARDLNQCTILCKSDNVTAVTYLNQKGGAHSEVLCNLALEIWEWCLSRGITVVAEHLPGRDNVTADQESRSTRDRCDWMLNRPVFQAIQQQMGPLELDLFASRLTAHLPRYYSWRPDPEAEATDAFTQNWAHSRGFANPPWCLISRCLTQVAQQEARIVMLTPWWNTQPWFPVILGMVEDYPRLLPNRLDLVTLPAGQEFIMPQGVPPLIAWPISGIPSHHRAFLDKLRSCSSHPGEQKQTKTTIPYATSGFLGVSQGIEIPLMAL